MTKEIDLLNRAKEKENQTLEIGQFKRQTNSKIKMKIQSVEVNFQCKRNHAKHQTN